MGEGEEEEQEEKEEEEGQEQKEEAHAEGKGGGEREGDASSGSEGECEHEYECNREYIGACLPSPSCSSSHVLAVCVSAGLLRQEDDGCRPSPGSGCGS